MLDVTKPQHLDRSKSTVTFSADDDALHAHIAHRHDEDSDIRVQITDDGAMIAWSTAHYYMYPGEQNIVPWPSAAVDTVVAVMCGNYAVQDIYRNEKLVKTQIVDTSGPADRVIITVAQWPWFRLGTKRVETRQIRSAHTYLPGLVGQQAKRRPTQHSVS